MVRFVSLSLGLILAFCSSPAFAASATVEITMKDSGISEHSGNLEITLYDAYVDGPLLFNYRGCCAWLCYGNESNPHQDKFACWDDISCKELKGLLDSGRPVPAPEVTGKITTPAGSSTSTMSVTDSHGNTQNGSYNNRTGEGSVGGTSIDITFK